MSRLVSTPAGFAGVCLVTGVICLAPTEGLSQMRGRPIEFSSPRGMNVETNLDQFDGKKVQQNFLRQKLEEEAYRPSSLFNSGDSLSGVLSLPPRAPAPPPVQSRRTRDLLDRQRNWIFMSPEDFAGSATMEEALILGLTDSDASGIRKKELSAMERFLRRMERTEDPNSPRDDDERDPWDPTSGKKRDKDKEKEKDGDSSSSSYYDSYEDRHDRKSRTATTDPRIAATENAFRKIFNAEPSGDIFGRDRETGLLINSVPGGMEAESFSTERWSRQQTRMDEFRQLLEPRAPIESSAGAAGSFSSLPNVTLQSSTLPTPTMPTAPSLPTAASTYSYPSPSFNPVSQPTYTAPSAFSEPVTAQPIRPLPRRQF